MESKTKQQKPKLRFSETLRGLFYAILVFVLLSSIVFQAFLFMEHLQAKQTLAAIDEKVNRLDQTLKMVFPSSPPHGARKNRPDAKDLHVRKRRSVTISLQSLEKRMKVLEMR